MCITICVTGVTYNNYSKISINYSLFKAIDLPCLNFALFVAFGSFL